ncbi:MAG: transglutaminase-like domain-containing protein [Pseudomonadota bacterium]
MKALQLVSNLTAKDHAAEIAALNIYVRDRIRYVRDVLDCETLQTPQATMELGQGDCDDKAILLASLLMSIGYVPRFVALNQGHGFVHVWTQVNYSGKWIDLEPTEKVMTGRGVLVRPQDKLLIWKII